MKTYKKKAIKEAIELLTENPIIIDRIRVVIGDPKMSDKKVRKVFRKVLYMCSRIGGDRAYISPTGDEVFITGNNVPEGRKEKRLDMREVYEDL